MGIEALAIGSLVAGVAGAGVSAYGASKSADAQAQTAQYQAAVARNNQIIANQNADAEATAGDVAATNAGLKGRAAVGSARVAAAANGLDVNTGSAFDLQTSTDMIHLLDAATIRNNAQRKAVGYRQQAQNFGAEGSLKDMAAKNAQDAGDIGVASSLIGGASSFSDKWMTYSNRGIL